jgi:hypothetical protein
MASRTTVTLVDDLDGSTADETVPFSLDGASYEIDLSADHADGLRTAFEQYVAAARRTGGRRTSSSNGSARASKSATGSSRERNQEIRVWASRNGAALADRGRIPGYVVEAFDAGDASRLAVSANQVENAPIRPQSESSVSAADPAQEHGDVTPARGRDGLTAQEREKIRAWAANEGIEVKARGILKKDLIGNYEAWSARQS